MGGCGIFRGAFVRLAHAEALHATGAADAARVAIGAGAGAAARHRRLGSSSRAYRASFLEEVPENARTLALAAAWAGAGSARRQESANTRARRGRPSGGRGRRPADRRPLARALRVVTTTILVTVAGAGPLRAGAGTPR